MAASNSPRGERVQLLVRAPKALFDAFVAHCEAQGRPRNDIACEALEAVISPAPQEQPRERPVRQVRA